MTLSDRDVTELRYTLRAAQADTAQDGSKSPDWRAGAWEAYRMAREFVDALDDGKVRPLSCPFCGDSVAELAMHGSRWFVRCG